MLYTWRNCTEHDKRKRRSVRLKVAFGFFPGGPLASDLDEFAAETTCRGTAKTGGGADENAGSAWARLAPATGDFRPGASRSAALREQHAQRIRVGRSPADRDEPGSATGLRLVAFVFCRSVELSPPRVSCEKPLLSTAADGDLPDGYCDGGCKSSRTSRGVCRLRDRISAVGVRISGRSRAAWRLRSLRRRCSPCVRFTRKRWIGSRPFGHWLHGFCTTGLSLFPVLAWRPRRCES
jgi:hypothetical protein